MLKNKNNFEIINSFFHCWAENFSEHPWIHLTEVIAVKKSIQNLAHHMLHISSFLLTVHPYPVWKDLIAQLTQAKI
jgi:hypothetical protein